MAGVKERLNTWYANFNAYDYFVGDYDYKSLFIPTWPFCRPKDKRRQPPPFFGVDEKMPFLLVALFGLQHGLSMLVGMVFTQLSLAKYTDDTDKIRELISSAIIVSGIATVIHSLRFKIPFTKLWYGTGLISVTGIATSFLPVITLTMDNLVLVEKKSFDEAYGKVIGTAMVCVWIQIFFSFLPRKFIKNTFPHFLIGTVILLLGIQLTTSSFKQWGGGSGPCANSYQGVLPAKPIPNCFTQDANGTFMALTNCVQKPVIPVCTTNGDVKLVFGRVEYIAMGCAALLGVLAFEVFGASFMRSFTVFLGVLVGYIVALFATDNGKHFITSAAFKGASNFSFLWKYTYPLGVYPPALLPFAIIFLVKTCEAVGDIAATCEVSNTETDGPLFHERVQGGILAEGFNCFLGLLTFTTPTTIYISNNGVVAISRCASWRVGVAAGVWVTIVGIFGKTSAIILSVPDCVMGAILCYIFASVAYSGVTVMTTDRPTRRIRTIITFMLAVGVGVNVVPQWATNALWTVYPGMPPLTKTLRDSVIYVISSGFALAFVVGLIMHLLLPKEYEPPGTSIHHQNHSMHEEDAFDERYYVGESDVQKAKPVDAAYKVPEPLELSRRDGASPV